MAIKFLNSVNADSGVLYVDAANDRVGIGTTSPGARLNVKSTDSTADQITLTHSGNTVNVVAIGQESSHGSLILRANSGVNKVRLSAAGNNSYILDSNVGIGTTSPNQKLHLYGGNISIDNSSDVALIFSKSGSSKYEWYLDNAANNFGLYDRGNSAWRFNVTNSGNVGIGNTSPAVKLAVAGTIQSSAGGSWASSAGYTQLTHDGSTTGYLSMYYDTETLVMGAGISQKNNITISGHSADNTIYFRVGNAERMRITNSGNVGIGTTSPSYRLEVQGDFYVNGSNGALTTASSQSNLYLLNLTRSTTSLITAGSVDVGGDLNFTKVDGIQIKAKESMIFTIDSDDNDTSRVFQFKDGSGDVLMTINDTGTLQLPQYTAGYLKSDASGNITVDSDTIEDTLDSVTTRGNTTANDITVGSAIASNTTDNDAAFRVQRTNALSSSYTELGTVGGSGRVESFNGNLTVGADANNSDSNSVIQFKVDNSEKVRITSSGNVGIGTTTPSADLHIGNNDPVIQIGTANTTTGNARLEFYSKNDGSANAYTLQFTKGTGVDRLDFIDGSGNARIVFKNGGYVGIGTTNPTAKLHISNTSGDANILLAGSSGQVLSIDQNSIRTTTASQIAIFTNSTTTNGLYINSSGNIGVGTTSPSEKLHVSGNVRIEGDLTVNGSYTQIDTDVNTTEQWNVTNDGTGPAVTINQTGAQDIMDVQDDGTSVFYIEDGGNVGIGTTDPTNTLHVNSGIVNEAAKFESTDGTVYISLMDNNTTNSLHGIGASGNTLRLYSNNSERLRIKDTGGLIFNNYGSNSFTGTAAYALAVDSSGNVIETSYIPSSSSTDFVAVTGDTMTGGLNIEVSASNTQLKLKRTTSATGEFNIYTNTDSLYFNNVANTSYPMVIDSNDRVGIGTTTPDAKLNVTDGGTQVTISNTYLAHLQSASNCGLAITAGASSNNYIAFGDTDDYDEGIINYNNSTRSFGFRTAGTGYDLTIDSSGNVGIGTTSPGAKLQVKTATDQNIAFNLISGGPLNGIQRISSYNDAITASVPLGIGASELYFLSGASSAERMRIDANGNVGVGTTNPSEKLEVNGNVKADSFIGGNEAGIYTFNDTVDASSSEDIFSIYNQHGAQAFRVTFVCSTSSYSVAKTFEVVHSHGNDPVFFKVVDTGAFSSNDFDVSFRTQAGGGSTDNNTIICEITNNSTTINADIATTVFLGGSPTTITVTAL